MSAQSLAGLSFPAFGVAIGLFFIIAPPEASGGGPAVSRWWGLAFILFGGMNLLAGPAIQHERGFLLAFAGFAFLLTLYMLLLEPWLEARKLRRYEAELSRAALATDHYSESLRAFHANSPHGQTPLRRWLCAAILIAFGTIWLVLGLSIPR